MKPVEKVFDGIIFDEGYGMHVLLDDMKPMIEDFLDDGSAVKHCNYNIEMRCKCFGGRL